MIVQHQCSQGHKIEVALANTQIVYTPETFLNPSDF